MRRVWSSIIGVIAVAAILAGINMIADTRLANAQLDVTQGHVYSLSKGTRGILRGLREPITLRLFYSPGLGARVPSYGSYADRVREVLAAYARASRGKVRLEFYNPEPFSDVEDRALAYGLKGVPLDQAGEQVYFGIVGTNLLDDVRTIAFLDQSRERFFEYDLTRLIYELSNPKRPVVGVLSPLPLEGNPQMMMRMGARAGRPWVSITQLRQTFTVRDVPLDTWTIAPDIQVLLVAQPQHLPQSTQYAIDQFVMRGGRLMLLVDPDSEAEASRPGPEGLPVTDTSSDLPKLFDAWGVAYDPNQVVGDLTGAWRVHSNPGDRIAAVDYVAWFNIRDGINHNDPATADLSQVTVAAAGFLGKKPGAAIAFTPLLTSSKLSGLIPAEKLRTGADPAAILADFRPAGGPRVIAARVRGVLKSAFTGPPAGSQGQAPPPPHLPAFRAHSDGPANLVVIADTDILADRYWVRVQNFFGQEEATPFSDNGAFIANMVGTLAGGDALIGLRGRGVAERPFTRVENIRRRAEARFRQTQQTLQNRLEATEKRLSQLRQGGGQNGISQSVLTPEQQSAITAVSAEILGTRKQLRNVQLDLKRDINRLETELRVFDIVLVPAILAVLAIILGFVRSRRRARARA